MREKMPVCGKCGQDIREGEEVPQGSLTLCDDCAMNALSPAKPCDPWAVKMATGGFSTKADAVKTLGGLEKSLYELVSASGKIPSAEAGKTLGVTEGELKRAFSVLRHMELLRASKNPAGGVDLLPF